MAAPIVKRKDGRFQTSEFGEYCEIEENILSMLQAGLSQENLGVTISTMETLDPKYTPIEDLPALYVYTDGSGSDYATIGALSGTKGSVHEEYFVSIEFWLTDVIEKEGHKRTRKICDKVRQILIENLDVNSIFSGNSELVEVDLRPKVRDMQKKPCLLQGFIIKMIYRKPIRSVGTKLS